MVESFRLDVWKGDWGLPSVDSPSLQVLAYAKFSGVPLDVHATNNPFRTPNGQLPVLRSGVNTLDSINDIIAFFKQKNYNADISLTPRQCAEIVAYDTMIREKIYPALQYIWWIDQRNVNDLIRPWYAKAVTFPLNFYYHGKYEAQAKSMMESLYPTEDNNAVIENGVYSEAQKCLTLLSTRLGESEFFYGSQPTSFDAIVYSYLAPLLKAPLPNPALQNHLKACTNLAKFVSRVSQRYFRDIYLEYEKEKAEENARKTRRDSESEFPNKRRNQFLAGVVAVLAMLGYALSSGVVKIPHRMKSWIQFLSFSHTVTPNPIVLWSYDRFVSNKDRWTLVGKTCCPIHSLLKVTIKDNEMLEAASEYILDDQDTAD